MFFCSTKRPAHLPPPPRNAPVGEPVTVLVVLENRLSVPMPVEDMQLVVTTQDAPTAGGGEGKEEEVACVAMDEEEFRKR